ncbi:RNA/RNP complex-1-interacting phosphatase isoform X1 [Synchiropus splendidus]|uniref:RNA/RNP complex-1-interacting phosphatase isoform X1 n=1 Tax=Synchiropus splendidus TaxID=270530 RepID=UPI00237D45B6|nr:RNA/RNP complex-1-interacting phosphatase isoform X1 [Synchiropus splendidus]
MSRHRKKGIPDRWLDYSPVGQRLLGTRFIAFKVPLKQSLCRQLRADQVFTPHHLVDLVTREGQELGLIVDLTYTSRYYSVPDVPDSVECVKIFTPGHEVPPDDVILKFKQVVRHFLRDNHNNDKLIGVHCTHGLNRTGYLICRYLIDVDGVDPVSAIKLFESSRGHVIERSNYLQDLQSGPCRSNEGMDGSYMGPVTGKAQGCLNSGKRHHQHVQGGIPGFRSYQSQPQGWGFLDPTEECGPGADHQRAWRHGHDTGFPIETSLRPRDGGSPRFSAAPWRRNQHLDQSPSRYNAPPRHWNPHRRSWHRHNPPRRQSSHRTMGPQQEGRPAPIGSLRRYVPYWSDQSH